jgi:hypothetical protein
MLYQPDTDEVAGILDTLMNAITDLQSHQNEDDRPVMELIEMVGVDVQDIIEATAQVAAADAAAELYEISTWLTAYRSDHPTIVTALTTLIDNAAATISNLHAA